jgi:hypothetical protein
LRWRFALGLDGSHPERPKASIRHGNQEKPYSRCVGLRSGQADLWRRAAKDANQVLIHWADLYRELLVSLGALASDDTCCSLD